MLKQMLRFFRHDKVDEKLSETILEILNNGIKEISIRGVFCYFTTVDDIMLTMYYTPESRRNFSVGKISKDNNILYSWSKKDISHDVKKIIEGVIIECTSSELDKLDQLKCFVDLKKQ